MKMPELARFLPSWKNAALALLSAILLVLAFPDFELSFLAWFSLVPLLWAVEREKESVKRSFILGWVWGFVFFTGTCWWLTFAPITYAGFPTVVAYLLLFCVTAVVGIFPAIFAAILSVLLRRFGALAFLAAPFVWVFSEFLRYWLTGNNWNAIGYSQFADRTYLTYASFGGVLLSSFLVASANIVFGLFLFVVYLTTSAYTGGTKKAFGNILKVRKNQLTEFIGVDASSKSAIWAPRIIVVWLLMQLLGLVLPAFEHRAERSGTYHNGEATVIAIQPNVPMAGLTFEKWKQLRAKHVELAESALSTINEQRSTSTTVIFPESPMNFAYEEDEEFRDFVHAFAAKHDVQVLFNSAEPDSPNNKYFNSAVLVGPDGKEIAQYDKIYLLPFGESVPAPLQAIVPAFVGSFSYGKEYDLLPLGDAKAGVMICFESHFGELGREYVRSGADVLIEMTNDGYLGPTPVLRQHLANAVFRAVETNRPVLRVTNVGITSYISERGEVLDASESYTEATRVWSVAVSNGSQTFYVRYGDWFAWLCSIVTVGLLGWAIIQRRYEPIATQ